MNWSVLRLLQVVAWLCPLLPPLLCENLLCFYSPILEIEKTFELIVTECPPNEVCFKAAGRYGNYTALSARGCLLEERCSRQYSLRLKGTAYAMSYSCCDRPYCNAGSPLRPLYPTVMFAAIATAAYTL
ncbi:protein Bouncer-like [Menidia menidia]